MQRMLIDAPSYQPATKKKEEKPQALTKENIKEIMDKLNMQFD